MPTSAGMWQPSAEWLNYIPFKGTRKGTPRVSQGIRANLDRQFQIPKKPTVPQGLPVFPLRVQFLGQVKVILFNSGGYGTPTLQGDELALAGLGTMASVDRGVGTIPSCHRF